MLFAQMGDQPVNPWMTFILGGGLVSVIGALWAGIHQLLKWRSEVRNKLKADEDKDEETAIARLEKVMEMREIDCTRRINELANRVEALEKSKIDRELVIDALREKVALYSARNKYLEAIARQAGAKPESWDKPDTTLTLPALDVTPPDERRK